MNIERIVSDLKKERDRLNSAIAALEGTKLRAARRASKGNGRRKRTRKLTPEGRKRLSEMMKKRWAEAKKKA